MTVLAVKLLQPNVSPALTTLCAAPNKESRYAGGALASLAPAAALNRQSGAEAD